MKLTKVSTHLLIYSCQDLPCPCAQCGKYVTFNFLKSLSQVRRNSWNSTKIRTPQQMVESCIDANHYQYRALSLKTFSWITVQDFDGKSTMNPLESFPIFPKIPLSLHFSPPASWIPITVNPDQLRRVLKKLPLGTNGIFREGFFFLTFDAKIHRS